MGSFYEFFAGGGMARKGLGPGWTCLFANDFDFKKGLTYQANFGAAELKVADIRAITLADLPGIADLMWGSFPCQDLSLAGVGAGLKGERSGTFYPFWDVVRALKKDGRAPKLIALENVCGTLTSHGGKDFEAICRTFSKSGYRCGALVINADLFVPQSRPRLFVIGVRDDLPIDPALLSPEPLAPFHTRGLCRAVAALPKALQAKRLWWNVPTPSHRVSTFAEEIEEAPTSVSWHSPAETEQLLAKMSPINKAKVTAAMRAGRRMVGGVYKRTRLNEKGVKVQRAEVRFDDVSGCETARLMGLPEDYKLPRNYNEAYHLTGDGVVVDVVRHLAQHVFEPLVAEAMEAREVA